MKNLKLSLLLIIQFSFFLSLKAQDDSYSIISKVFDSKDNLAFGNMLVLSVEDSTMIKGTFFIDGKAEISVIKEPGVLVKYTSIGYRDTILNVSNTKLDKVVDLGKIVLQDGDMNLNEVTVTAKLPLFEPTPEGAVKVNVQNTMLASSSGLLEVLAKSPNILVGDNSIIVIGKGEALLYLDGNPITMQQLSSVSVNQIKNIEIITNPSARYDASGRAVINITTIENNSEGWQGSVLHNSTFAKDYLGSTFLNLNYRKKKWAFSGGYGLLFGRDWNQLTATRTLTTDAGVFVSDNFHNNKNKLTNQSNYNAGLTYNIDQKNKISLEYRGFNDLVDLDESVQNNLLPPSGERGVLKTQNDGQNKRSSNSLILNYLSDLDTLGSSLFVGGQYSIFNGKLNDLIFEEYVVENVPQYGADRKSNGLTDIAILTSQLDYIKKFTNRSKLETGIKYAKAQNTGQIDFFSKPQNTSEFEIVNTQSNNFEYEENIPAAYLQYFDSLGSKTIYNIGARLEYTNARGYSKVLNQQVIDTSYINVFPTVSITTNLLETFSTGLAYSARINRPKYQQLDPFVQYQDSLTSFQGNPLLLPELTQAVELNLNIQGFNFLKLGYNYSENAFRDIVEPGAVGPNSVVLKTVNVQLLESYFATLNVPIDIKFWSSYNTLSLSFDKIKDNNPVLISDKIIPRFYIYSYHKFNVKSWFNFELFGEYVGKQDDGIYFTEPTYSISCALSKKILKDKLICRVVANDIFKTYKQAGNFEIGSTYVVHDTKLNTNFYRLSITYNFGKLKNSSYKIKDPGSKEKDRIQ